MPKKVLVTGVSGYIGSSCAIFLANEGYDVIGYGHATRFDEIKKVPGMENLSLIQGDVTDKEALIEALRGVYAIVHTAAPTGEKACQRDPWGAIRSIVRGSRVIAEAALELKIEHLVHISTQAVYSTFQERRMPLKEEDELLPDDWYGSLKAEAEYEISKAHARILRLSNVYGRGAGLVLKTDVVGNYIRALREGKNLTVFGDGNQGIDFVHIDDVLRVVKKCIELEPQDRVEVFNVGSGTMTSIFTLASTLVGLAGEKSHVVFEAAPPGKLWPPRMLDITKVQKLCPSFPQTSIEDGLKEFFKE